MSTTHLLPRRSVAVLKMHLVDRLTLFVVPLAIAGSSFAINLAVWQFVDQSGRTSGGATSLHFFVFAAAVFAVVRGLPFALGMGASRRAFVLGTTLTGAALALVMGTLWAALRQVEIATGGWGRQGHFFDFPWMHRSSAVVVWAAVTLSIATVFALGALVAGWWARFGRIGLALGGPALVLLLGGLVVLVSAQHWWGDLWSWCADQTPLTTCGWLLVATLVLDAATWLTLRRVRAT